MTQEAKALVLGATPDTATAGYFQLSWPSAHRDDLILEKALTPDFDQSQRIVVTNVNSITLTGYENGEYYFRLVTSEGSFSNTVRVVVAHHSLAKAIMFFLVGLLLFIYLIYVLWSGQGTSLNGLIHKGI